MSNNDGNIPIGLDPKLFILCDDSNRSYVNKDKASNDSLSYSNIYDGILLWSKLSHNLGFINESKSIDNISEKFLAACHVIETKSEQANEACMRVTMALPESIQQQISIKIVNGCAYETYNYILKILHSMKDSTPDRFKLSSAISFLDSDKDVNDSMLAHQIIEDTYQVLKGIMPELNLNHDTKLLGMVYNHLAMQKLLSKTDCVSLNHPTTSTVCGKCQFKFTKYK